MLMKQLIYIMVVYSNHSITCFIAVTGQRISSNHYHWFVLYTDSGSLIDKLADKYRDWLDKLSHLLPDCLQIIGTMKKKKNFIA